MTDNRLQHKGYCPYAGRSCVGKCKLLDTTISLVHQLLSERDLRIMEHHSTSISHRDYIANISRRIDDPYMSVKRSLDLLISLKLVISDERAGASYNFFRLTVLGRALAGTEFVPVTQSYGFSIIPECLKIDLDDS